MPREALSTFSPLAFRMPFLSGARSLRFPPALAFVNSPSTQGDLSQHSLPVLLSEAICGSPACVSPCAEISTAFVVYPSPRAYPIRAPQVAS